MALKKVALLKDREMCFFGQEVFIYPDIRATGAATFGSDYM